jgi:hypothetical protein
MLYLVDASDRNFTAQYLHTCNGSLKQVDALNGADEKLDEHACKHRPKL